jgi:two-component system, cell cycle sensor histidine kinase and response regulator CckA
MTQPNSAPSSEPRLRLARLAVSQHRSLSDACEHAAKISARTLRVARVGIWLFEEEGAVLRRVHLEGGDAQGAPAGPAVLRATQYPTYVQALSDNRWVCAHDALHDPVTRELAEDYLVPLGITSMLDAPIFRSGDLFGVVCHEHLGPAREWSALDRAFAGSVADILALVFEQAAHLSTERERSEAELRQQQAQKLEVLGRLALGVAHDVNNIFTAVALLAGRLAQSPDERVAAMAREIQEASAGASSITSSLVAFARQQSSVTTKLDATETVAALQPMLRAVAGNGVSLEIAPGPGALFVRAAPGQLQQVLLNLVLNARDAMNGQGTVTVRVDRRPGGIVFEVSDEGPGMPADVRARLFELYVTTRADGGGAGVGLATVKSIVDALDGHIELDTSSRGTTFRVVVPEAVD